MADLGSIATLSVLTKRHLTGANLYPTLRVVVCGHTSMVVGGKDSTEGILRMDAKGMWRFRWVVASGNRTIEISVKQPVNLTPYPTLTVKANPDIGVNSDVTETSPGGAGYVTIGPASISPSSAGAVWVELKANYDGQYGTSPCYWKDVTTT